jgi:MFS family permease
MNALEQTQQDAERTLTSCQSTLWNELRSLPKAAWVLFFGIFLNRFGTFVIPFLTLYMKKQGYSIANAGAAVGAYGAGTFLASFFGGYLADRIGRRKTITFSMAGGAVTMLLMAAANSPWAIIIIASCNGLFGELYRPASTALLADLVPAGKRVIAFSAYRVALNAGWAFGPATAGFLANRSFIWLFVGDAFSSLLFGLVAWCALPHGVRSSSREAGWAPVFRSVRGNPDFIRFLAASMFIAFIFYQISSTYSLFITDLGYSPAVYGALISFNGFVVVCFELVVSNFTRRFNPRRAIAVGFLLAGLGFGLNAFVSTIPLLGIAVFIFSFGEMTSIPVASAFIADLAPADMRGRYMGVHGLAWGVTLVFSPVLGMILYAQNPQYVWLMCGLFGIIAAVIMSWGRPLRIPEEK